jgi:capsid portal protein
MSDGNGNGTTAEAVLVKENGEFELRAIEVAQGSGTSTQSASEDELWTPDDTFQPPEDLHALARLTDNSSIRETCIGAIARNTVGLGWDVDVWEGAQASPEDKSAARREIDVLARRDRILDRPSFTSLMYAIKWDEEECGNAAMEVSRNKNTGKIDGLYHVPGMKVRRKKDLSGYVIGTHHELGASDPQRRDFYNFGEKVEYDRQGRPTRRLQSGKRWKTNELIVFRRYTSASRHYGLPRDIGLAFEYAAARFLNEWTSSFFEGSGTPPTIVFVAGNEGKSGQRIHFTVPEATVRRIQQAVKSDSKPGARVAIIPVPPGTTVSDVKLGQQSDKDLTFETWRKLHERHVGAGFDLMPIFYGLADDGGRYTAEVQRAFTLEETFDPDQREHEDKIWNTLFTDLGYSELRPVFKRLAVEGDAVKREAAVAMAEAGGITVREFRAAHGYGPLDEAVHGEGANEKIIFTGKPRGAEDRVAVRATQDQRGQRPGIGGRVAKTGDEDHPHGVEHVEQAASELEAELIELVESDE